MGWCSGTSIFDPVAAKVIDNPILPVPTQVAIITALYQALRDKDLDCQNDSKYAEHPVFITARFIDTAKRMRVVDERFYSFYDTSQVLWNCVPPELRPAGRREAFNGGEI